jgi:hypothetical protein
MFKGKSGKYLGCKGICKFVKKFQEMVLGQTGRQGQEVYQERLTILSTGSFKERPKEADKSHQEIKPDWIRKKRSENIINK